MATGEARCPVALSSLIGVYRDPHGLYDAARERGGVALDPVSGCWLVTGHAAVRSILEDPRFSSRPVSADAAPLGTGPVPFVQAAVQRQILFSDGEDHLRVQKVILHETARRKEALTEALREVARDLVGPLASRGRFDLVKDFALPYALQGICRFLDLPVDDPRRLAKLAEWSTTYADVTSGHLGVRMQQISLLGDYFRDVVAERRASSSDDPIGALLRAGVFEDDEDVVINCMMLFSAGRVTTQRLLANGFPVLLPHWGRWRALVREDPGLGRRLTEELLRVVTPTRYVARRATLDVHVPGGDGTDRRIERGAKVVLFLEAANRDPEAFCEPHAFHAARRPNPHLAFGHGSHRCPGAGMARLEIWIALEVLLERLPGLRADPSREPSWDPNPNLGGFSSFPCLCD